MARPNARFASALYPGRALPAAALFALLACQAQIGGDPNRGDLLHSLAAASAKAFASPEVREEFASAIRRQDVAEGKIRLSEIASGGSFDGLVPLDALRASLTADGQDFPALLSAFPEDVELYIPIPEQRAAFTAGDEVVFVPADPELEDEDADLEAYDEEGQRLFLPRAPLPEVTVIAVAAAERAPQAGLAEELDFSPKAPPLAEQRIEVGPSALPSACNGRAHVDGDAEVLQDFMIRNAREFWLFGAPEIVIKMAFPNGEQGTFSLNGGVIDVNDVNRIYPVELPLFRWDRDIFAQDVLFRVVETDGGFSADLVVTANVALPGGIGSANVDFRTTIQNLDDDMGIQFVRFDDPCGSLYSTGEADWHLYFRP
jgi:hypothetical protein